MVERQFFYILLFWIMLSSHLSVAQAQKELEKYAWKSRVLLVFCPPEKKWLSDQQMNALAQDLPGIADRTIVVFKLAADQGTSPDNRQLTAATVENLRRTFRIASDDFGVILLGKDGGEKYRKSAPVTLAELFGVIDAMPMRQSEMKNRKF